MSARDSKNPLRTNENASVSAEAAANAKTLERFGYKQELKRELGYFSSFALSFSIISVTTGLFADYGEGLHAAGPAFIWTWLIVGAGQFLVALVFARLSRQIPLSGYAYQWTRELAGERAAWWAGWMMILQFIAGMPGVCYALANYLVPFCGYPVTQRNIVFTTVLILLSIALINHFGVRLASRINDFSVGAEVLGTVLVGVALLVVAIVRKTNSPHFLFTHPQQPGGLAYIGAFAFSSLMGAWTLTGFEGAANLAEETKIPERQVPFAIVGSVVSSVLLGFLILVGFTLAIPSLKEATASPAPLLYIIGAYFSPAITKIVMLLVFLSIYACALANLATLTRIVWALARDKQLPGSSWLVRVNGHQVPGNAIWFVTVIAAIFTFWAKFEIIMTGIAAIAGYVTYAIVVSAALKANSRNSSMENSEAAVPRISVPRGLCVAALIWIVFLLCFLSLPRTAWTNSIATVIAAAVGLIVYLWMKRTHGGSFGTTRMAKE